MNDTCGLLIEGFDRPPMALMPYNPPSYGPMLESLGLAKCKDLYAYLISGDDVRPGTEKGDRLVRLAAALRRRHPRGAPAAHGHAELPAGHPAVHPRV